MNFYHKNISYINLIFLNIFFLSTSLLIYLASYIYQFQLGYYKFFYFNIINFAIIPLFFSIYVFISKKIILNLLIAINILILSFLSSRVLFFYLLKNELVIFNKVIFFLILFVFYFCFIYYFLNRIDLKKKIILSLVYIITLFVQFPYEYLENNILKKKNQENIIARTKPPIFILVLDEVSRKILLDENNTISENYPSLRNFEKNNINFINAQTNYALSKQIFYSMFKGSVIPEDQSNDYINFWNIEGDENNLFDDFINLDYEINIFSHLIFCKNKKFFCQKPINDKKPLSYIYIKFLSTLIPDDIESRFLPFLQQKKIDRDFFYDFTKINFQNNNLYFFHTLLAHKPWLLDNKLKYIYDFNYKFKKNNKNSALKNYKMALTNLDNSLGNFFKKIKDNNYEENSIIIIMSDHGICFESYCRNRIENLVNYDEYLSNILFLVKYNNKSGVYEKRFDIINLRKFILDLILEKNFNFEKNFLTYSFFDITNKPIKKSKTE